MSWRGFAYYGYLKSIRSKQGCCSELRSHNPQKHVSRQADSFSIRRFVSFWAKFQSRVGLRGLFSGVQAAGLRAATYGSVRIGLCEPLQQAVGNKTQGALAAGVLATVVGNPFEVLKVRLQARPGAVGELQLLRSMLQEDLVVPVTHRLNP